MNTKMKIAMPVTADQKVDDHFGHCEYYGIYTINDSNEVTHTEVLPSQNGCGCKSGIAEVLGNQGVTMMLAGGIGGGAINVLNHYGIEVIRGCSGKAEDVVKAFIAGSLTDSGESCHHHEHHHGHNDGHSSGHHHHGISDN